MGVHHRIRIRVVDRLVEDRAEPGHGHQVDVVLLQDVDDRLRVGGGGRSRRRTSCARPIRPGCSRVRRARGPRTDGRRSRPRSAARRRSASGGWFRCPTPGPPGAGSAWPQFEPSRARVSPVPTERGRECLQWVVIHGGLRRGVPGAGHEPSWEAPLDLKKLTPGEMVHRRLRCRPADLQLLQVVQHRVLDPRPDRGREPQRLASHPTPSSR